MSRGQTIDETMEDLRDAVQAQTTGLRLMLGHQAVHDELLRKVLDAVTAEPEGDDKLGVLLAEMVAEARQHTAALDGIAAELRELRRAVGK